MTADDACREAQEEARSALHNVRAVALPHVARLRELLAPWADTDEYLREVVHVVLDPDDPDTDTPGEAEAVALGSVLERLDARERARAREAWQTDPDVWASMPPPDDLPSAAESAQEMVRLAGVVLVIASHFIGPDFATPVLDPADETHEDRAETKRIVKMLRLILGPAADPPEGSSSA